MTKFIELKKPNFSQIFNLNELGYFSFFEEKDYAEIIFGKQVYSLSIDHETFRSFKDFLTNKQALFVFDNLVPI